MTGAAPEHSKPSLTEVAFEHGVPVSYFWIMASLRPHRRPSTRRVNPHSFRTVLKSACRSDWRILLMGRILPQSAALSYCPLLAGCISILGQAFYATLDLTP